MANKLDKSLEGVLGEDKVVRVDEKLTEKPRILVTVRVNDDEPSEFDLDTLFLIGIHKDGLDEEKGGATMAVYCVGVSGGGYSKSIRGVAERYLKERYPIPEDALGGLAGLLEMLKGAKE